MSGTKAGAKKASATNRAKYGDNFYSKIGAKGGSRQVKKGFGANPELASRAGRLGGKTSTKSSNHQYIVYEVRLSGERFMFSRHKSKSLAKRYADKLNMDIPYPDVDHYEIEQAPELSKDYNY